MYIKRTIEKTIKKMSNEFPVIVISGARQVGKSTMLQRNENFHIVQQRLMILAETIFNK